MRMCSLFAGIGGFDLAAQRVGLEPAVAVEIEPFARKVLAKRFPETRLLGDVTGVTGADLGSIDLLTGGFPCQDVSVAGKRAGLAGERTGLFWEIVRLADECHPRWLLLENVPGLLSSNERRDFGTVLGALGELGYGYASRVLDAQYMRVAQRRRRVFIVGCLGDARRAAEVLFEPESCARHPAPSRQAGTRAAYSLSRGSARSSGVNEPGRRAEDDVNLVAIAFNNGQGDPNFSEDGSAFALSTEGDSYVAATLNSGGNSGGFRTEPGEHLVAAALLSSRAGYRSDYETETFVSMPLLAKANDSHAEDGTGRGALLIIIDQQNAAAVPMVGTLDSGASHTNRGPAIAYNWQSGQDQPQCSVDVAPMQHGGQTPAVGVRRLMPVECERLQGFPDGWTCLHDHPQQCDCPDSARYRALGNAVAVPVAEWILRRMIQLTSHFGGGTRT